MGLGAWSAAGGGFTARDESVVGHWNQPDVRWIRVSAQGEAVGNPSVLLQLMELFHVEVMVF